eukprot:365741-Chlamydomonas_euryale.AAC.12
MYTRPPCALRPSARSQADDIGETAKRRMLMALDSKARFGDALDGQPCVHPDAPSSPPIKPGGMVRDDSPPIKPGGMVRDDSPTIKPGGMARDDSPPIKPGGMARDNSPQTQPSRPRSGGRLDSPLRSARVAPSPQQSFGDVGGEGCVDARGGEDARGGVDAHGSVDVHSRMITFEADGRPVFSDVEEEKAALRKAVERRLRAEEVGSIHTCVGQGGARRWNGGCGMR